MFAEKFVPVVFAVFLVSCAPAATEAPTPTATLDLQTPMAMTASAQTQMVEAADSTADAQATLDMMAATEAAEATASAESAYGTATQLMVLTETKATNEARNTETAATRQAGTEQAILSATEQAQPMADLVNNLYEDGYLVNTEGSYMPLFDFDQSWAQINWFQWFPTFMSPDDFIVRADVTIESASDKANWWNAGCGFVFREQGDGNFYVVFLNLDGNVDFMKWRNGNGSQVQRAYYGKMDTPKSTAEIVLVAEDTWVTVLVNGQKVIRATDSSFDSGTLNFTLASGTNLEYGTRCTMTNVGYWDIGD